MLCFHQQFESPATEAAVVPEFQQQLRDNLHLNLYFFKKGVAFAAAGSQRKGKDIFEKKMALIKKTEMCT